MQWYGFLGWFEVNKMHLATRKNAGAVGCLLPAMLLAGCVSDADTFKSRPDAPPDAGRGAEASELVVTSDTAAAVESHAESTAAFPVQVTTGSSGGSSEGQTGPEASGTGGHGDASSDVTPTSASVDGTSESGATDSGQNGVIPSGSVPAELVGVWQQTRAGSADYADEFGETFSDISGFSVQLKITAEGRYSFAHYTSGTFGDCATVTRFDESKGTATLDGNILTLQPVARRIDDTDCDGDSSDDANLEPMVLTVRLTQGRELQGGMRTFVMSAEGYGFPLSLTSLFRQPTYVPDQPIQPEEFVLGVNGPFADLQGLWLASATGTDSNFYDSETDEYYFPEPNGSPQQWLRFDGGEYEAAVALQNVNTEGVCKLDLIYYERGSAAFEVLEDVGGLGSHYVGHVALDASDSRLVVNIRECDEDDGALRYDLPPLTSYLRWVYLAPDNSPESFSLVCDFPKSEWQSLLCDTGTVELSRPE